MAKKLYFECASGISGDMTAAALIDLGADRAALDRALNSLDIGGFEVKISRVKKSGIDACDFNVILQHDNHDHDMEYLHGHEHNHGHEHGHEHNHGHGHAHRGLNEITEIINRADLTEGARALAHRIFRILAEAEAKAHAVEPDSVHFHEVGAVDSIVDIIAAAVCADSLGIDSVIVPALTEGSGFVRCQHGVIPVPVPAVVNIAEANGLTLKMSGVRGELVTPTGAAIAAALKTESELPESFKIVKCGIGAGKREYEVTGILRAMIIEADSKDAVYKLETNIDDCNGEALGYTLERLFDAGAKDVYYSPVYMKKNRPAYVLNVICEADKAEACEKIIFENTTTIGIRRIKTKRTILERTFETVLTSLGEVKIKKCFTDGFERAYPEYESICEICKKHGIAYYDAYRTIIGEI